MHVLAFCDYYSPSSIGGAERVAREIYGRLVSDHSVDVTVVGGLPGATDDGPTATGPRVRLVRGHDLSAVLGAQLLVSPGLAARARAEVERVRPDVIHVNGLHFHSSIVGARIGRRYGIPVVSTAHLGNVGSMPSRLPGANSAFDRVVGGLVVRRSAQVLAVSPSVAQHLHTLGVSPEKVTVARNGVDQVRFRPAGSSSDRGWLQAIIVGRLIATKGPLHALEAVASVRATGRDVRLQILGDGPQLAEVRRRSEQPDLAGAIELVGSVDDVEVWLRNADIALRPSYTEGLPLAVLEALASGTPVICTDVAGNLDAITDQDNGLVVGVGDEQGLATALATVYDDRTRLRAMSERAATSARAFSWDASAALHLQALEHAIGATAVCA